MLDAQFFFRLELEARENIEEKKDFARKRSIYGIWKI